MKKGKKEERKVGEGRRKGWREGREEDGLYFGSEFGYGHCIKGYSS